MLITRTAPTWVAAAPPASWQPPSAAKIVALSCAAAMTLLEPSLAIFSVAVPLAFGENRATRGRAMTTRTAATSSPTVQPRALLRRLVDAIPWALPSAGSERIATRTSFRLRRCAGQLRTNVRAFMQPTSALRCNARNIAQQNKRNRLQKSNELSALAP